MIITQQMVGMDTAEVALVAEREVIPKEECPYCAVEKLMGRKMNIEEAKMAISEAMPVEEVFTREVK